MRNKSRLMATVIALAIAVPQHAAAEFGVNPAQLAQLENEVDQAMIGNLEDFIGMTGDLKGPILPPYICPEAIEILALVATGRTSPQDGAKGLIKALMNDRNAAIAMVLDTGKMPDMTDETIKMHFQIKDEKTASVLQTLARDGMKFLAN